MDDESKVTQDTEVKEDVKITTPEDKKPEVETVPLAVYLDLKEDMKVLKKEIKDSKVTEKETVAIEGLDELSKKYPDVNKEFIQDILGSATKEATKKIEEKYTPIIAKQEEDKKKETFDKAFDALFTKTLEDNPELPKTIDKELIKELAITPKYLNVPLADILTKMYGSTTSGRSSSEDDMRTGADRVEDIVSFEKITKAQKDAILDDPKARQKYFNWLDTQFVR